MIDTGYKLDLSKIEKVIDEVKKPMSLNQLKAKFGLPLKVKVVKHLYNKNTGEKTVSPGEILDFDGKKCLNGYWESKQGSEFMLYDPDSKKFMLVE